MLIINIGIFYKVSREIYYNVFNISVMMEFDTSIPESVKFSFVQLKNTNPASWKSMSNDSYVSIRISLYCKILLMPSAVLSFKKNDSIKTSFSSSEIREESSFRSPFKYVSKLLVLVRRCLLTNEEAETQSPR